MLDCAAVQSPGHQDKSRFLVIVILIKPGLLEMTHALFFSTSG